VRGLGVHIDEAAHCGPVLHFKAWNLIGWTATVVMGAARYTFIAAAAIDR
jgi:hypothetical protein